MQSKMNPPPQSDQQPAYFWCHACRRIHSGAPAGSLRSTLHFCEIGIAEFSRMGIIEPDPSRGPNAYRLMAQRTERR
jgi:hypothetical protein